MTGLEQVRGGMRVVDSLGQDVGTVDRVEHGAGGPVTTRGCGGLPSGLARALRASSDVHPQTAARMLRSGYLRIRRGDLLPAHGYAPAHQIRDVRGDVVRLAVSRDEVLRG